MNRRGLLHERKALIVGAGPGLGRDTALAFAREGADVALMDIDGEAMEATAADVRATGAKCSTFVGDMTRTADCDRVVAGARAVMGRLTTVAVVAYFSSWQGLLESDDDLTNWRRSYEVNALGGVRIGRSAARVMIEDGVEGSMTFVNSMVTERSNPRVGPYSGSKVALLAYTRAMAVELAPEGIRVNSVHPGWMKNPKTDVMFESMAQSNGTTADEVRNVLVDCLPLGRMVTPANVADGIVFLSSDLAAGTTGHSLHVDGGQWLAGNHPRFDTRQR